MNINSSLPLTGIANKGSFDRAAAERRQPLSGVAQEYLQGDGDQASKASKESLEKSRQPIVPFAGSAVQNFRSERVDLRVLSVETESLLNKRALNAYQTTATILQSESSDPIAGLDLFA